jgi:hypothetical protein
VRLCGPTASSRAPTGRVRGVIRCRTPTRSSSAIVSSTPSVDSGGARRTGRSLLRDLEPGSLILFGSFKAGEFVLDTVFVTGEGIRHDHDSWSRVLTDLPETYVDVTMLATYAWGPGAELRFYSGATLRRSFTSFQRQHAQA